MATFDEADTLGERFHAEQAAGSALPDVLCETAIQPVCIFLEGRKEDLLIPGSQQG